MVIYLKFEKKKYIYGFGHDKPLAKKEHEKMEMMEMIALEQIMI